MRILKTKIKNYRKRLHKFTLAYEEKFCAGESMMSIWLKSINDAHEIILIKEKNIIVGWGIIVPEGFYEKDNGTAGIYVSPKYRGKGIGVIIGRELFIWAKQNGYKKIEINYRNIWAEKTYKKVIKELKIKRFPFTPSKFISYSSDWKVVVL